MTFTDLRKLLPQTAQSIDGVLHIGGVDVREIAQQHGTPVVILDELHVREAARQWRAALDGYAGGSTVVYATKALSTVALLQIMVQEGLGADVSTGGELEVARRAGVPAHDIVVHGNNKSVDELRDAVAMGVGLIVIDAPDELELVGEVAREAGRVQRVLVRVNPDIAVETHHYIRTAHSGSKFGLSADDACTVIAAAAAHDHVEAVGMHVHLGSQLLELTPWPLVIAWCADFAKRVREQTGVELSTLDLGGGLGIAYTPDQTPPTVPELMHCIITSITEHWDGTLPHLILEPGRAIVGPAAVTLYEVGVVKGAGDINYVSVDGGMSDNLRPMLYQAEYSALVATRADAAPTGTWWITGKHCESGDVLIEDAPLPDPKRGDLLAIAATGAYTLSMASNYNQVPRAPLVIACDGTHTVALRRETIDDVLSRDVPLGGALAASTEPTPAAGTMRPADAVAWATDHIAASHPHVSRAVIAAATGAVALGLGEDDWVSAESVAMRALAIVREIPAVESS